MALLGHLINRSLRIRKNFTIITGTARSYQMQVLKRLLRKAKNTHFGRHYHFDKIIEADKIYTSFKEKIPFHNYNQMYGQWWKFCQEGEHNVCWPGKVKYFALSSGTSESSSKHIPVTDDMIKSVKKAGMKQSAAYQKVGFEADARNFRPTAEILADLKVKSVILLTGNIGKAEDLRRWSIVVSGTKETKI